MRFDEVDLDAAGAGRISDAELVERVRTSPMAASASRLSIRKVAGFQAVTHVTCPCHLRVGAGCRAAFTNKWLTRR